MEKTKAKMKDSGVEWIGKIPEDWDTVRVKRLVKKQNPGVWGEESKGDANDLPCLRVADFDYDRLSFSNVETIRNIPRDQHVRILKNGSVLIERSGGGEKQPVGRAIYFESNQKMVCANFVDSIEVQNFVDPKYFTYLLSAAYSVGLNTKSIKQSTGIQNLDTYSYFSEMFPSPAKEIQESVVKYLNSKAAAIDQAIEQKRKLIDLLKEKRTAIINRAVTRGLDENVELVDSGVEWIGKVPKGWKVERLKSIADINRHVLSENTPSDQVINYLDIGDIESNGVSSVPTEYLFENAPSRARRLVHDGTVILATVRTYLRAISYIENPADNLIVSTGFATLDANSKVIPKYLYYLASSELIIQNVVRYSTGVSYPAIAPTVLGGLPVIYPSVEIQKRIITHLDESLAVIDSAIEKIQISIRLLNEYRTSLISHVVTGKVEV